MRRTQCTTDGVATPNVLLIAQYGFADEANVVGTATLLQLPEQPAPKWLVDTAPSDDGSYTVLAHSMFELPPFLRTCGELLQSAFSKPKSGKHLYHTRTNLDAMHGVSDLMVDCVRIHMSFNNISHLKIAVAEGSFIVTSQEMKNSFQREQNILRQQISAVARPQETAVRMENWPGSRRWRYAVAEMQFAERVAKTDLAVYHSMLKQCAAFAKPLRELAGTLSADKISDSWIGTIIDALHEESAAEDEDGGVSLEAVASSLLARWVAKELEAARRCEVEMTARLRVAEEMLEIAVPGGGVAEVAASTTATRGDKVEL